MGKAQGLPGSLQFLIVVTFLAIVGTFAVAQDASLKCSNPTAEISRISRPTGVLRADPNANDTASRKIASDVSAACPSLSDPSAFRLVRMQISDNHIVLNGTVPTESDEEQLIAIVTANADGRTVFNRLAVANPQMASRARQ